jgi:cytochrome P450
MSTPHKPPVHPRDKDHPGHAAWVERIRESMREHWEHAPKKQRAALARRAATMSQQRWKKPRWRSKQARSEFAAYVSSHITERVAGGRPRLTDRCACGQYSRSLAE